MARSQEDWTFAFLGSSFSQNTVLYFTISRSMQFPVLVLFWVLGYRYQVWETLYSPRGDECVRVCVNVL